MMPLYLRTTRYAGGFRADPDNPSRLIADELSAEEGNVETIDLESPLFVKFLNSRTDDDLIAFINRYGDLPSYDLREESQNRSRMAELAEMALNSSAPAAAVNTLFALIPNVGLVPRMRNVGGKSRLFATCRFVQELMVLEIAFGVEAGASLASCEHCGRYFTRGPMTRTRADAKYCSDKCRVAAMRARNAARENNR